MLKAGTAARRRSLTFAVPVAPDQIRAQIEALLHATDARLQQGKQDWVGHVKILITNGTESAYGSLTAAGDAPHWSGKLTADVARAEMTVYAAIYSLTDADVAAAVDGSLTANMDGIMEAKDESPAAPS